MELSDETFVVDFYVAKRFVQEEPQWEEACWDEALRMAHQQGKIPVGPILITVSEIDQSDSQKLMEGVPMSVAPLFALTSGGVVKITASCMIGTSL